MPATSKRVLIDVSIRKSVTNKVDSRQLIDASSIQGANTMDTHEFTLILASPTELTEELANQFFEAGCDDATVSYNRGHLCIEFSRESENLEEAISSAIDDVVKVSGVTVRSIEPRDLVSASEIARRLDKSRELVRLYVAGKRGDGDFPLPVIGFSDLNSLWSWADVAEWATKKGWLSEHDNSHADTLRRYSLKLLTATTRT
jgi:hypothetical protein